MVDNLFQHEILSPEKEQALTQQYSQTRSIALRNLLVQHNLRLVSKIANEFSQERGEDLFNEGCLGLVKGVENFQPDKGCKLSTYCAWWIRAYCFKYLERNNMFRIATTEAQRKIFWAVARVSGSMEARGEEATPEKLAEALSCAVSDITELQIRRQTVWSLDKPLDEEGGTLLEVLASEGISPDQALQDAEKADIMKRHLSEFRNSLPPAEKVVFDQRLLEDETLQAVGDRLNLTRERIRQIETKIKQKLLKYSERKNILAAL